MICVREMHHRGLSVLAALDQDFIEMQCIFVQFAYGLFRPNFNNKKLYPLQISPKKYIIEAYPAWLH